jgi:hypothetical protein
MMALNVEIHPDVGTHFVIQQQNDFAAAGVTRRAQGPWLQDPAEKCNIQGNPRLA